MQATVTEREGSASESETREPQWHTLEPQDVLRAEQVDAECGLSTAEAKSRTEQYGPNKLAEGKRESRWHAFIRQYQDPMQIALLIAGIISLILLKQVETGALLILLTIGNAVLGLRQEGEASDEVAALQQEMTVTARVRRDGQESEIPAEQVVPGDVVSIAEGDIVPADGRLIRTATLEIDESDLTGESLPVAKGTDRVADSDAALGDRTDMVYMKTSVTRGTGQFVVTATGMATEVGHVSGMMEEEQESKTPLTRQLDDLYKQILVIASLALAASMALNLSHGASVTTAFNGAVAFLIAAVPVQLPTVVTSVLAWGTEQLAKAGAVMKQLRSTETLGSTSAICSDKTGTLTLNQMTAVEMDIAGHRYTVEGKGYSTEGRINRVAGDTDVPLDPFLMPMVLASDAVIRDGKLIGDPTEGALVTLAAKGGVDASSTRQAYPRLAEVPFDAAYKLMATFHRMRSESGEEVIRCFVKGAPDQLLERAGSVVDPDKTSVPADDHVRELYRARNQGLAELGLRVMATARRDLELASFDAEGDLLALVTDLELLALVGIVDPPRPNAGESVEEAKSAGIAVRMITGDYAVTAAAIAEKVDIDGRVIKGTEFAAMNDDEVGGAVDDIGVIARVSPEHKVRLVDVLQRKDQIVAMTGDGVNDAPALKKADIGIAMGSGTEVAKQAAVMVLTDDNFSTIVKAVEIGRQVYYNLVRYVRYQVGCMFGFIFTLLGGSIFSIAHGVPLLPIQVLWVSFVTVTVQSLGLGYSSADEGLMKRRPRSPHEPILNRDQMLSLATGGVVMAAGTLVVTSLAEHTHTLAFARTIGMITLSMFCLFFSFEAKDEQKSAFSLDTFSDRTFRLTSAASLFLIAVSTLLQPLKTTHLTFTQFLICSAVALLIIVVAEIQKAVRRRIAAKPGRAEQGEAAATSA